MVPCHNAAEFVEETIRSVLTQTHQNVTVVAVDDGSTDGTAAILERMALEDARIKVVRQPNAGVSSARNAGLDQIPLARYALFLDADDILLPTAVEELVSIAEARSEVIGVHGLAEQFGPGATPQYMASLKNRFSLSKQGVRRLADVDDTELSTLLIRNRIAIGTCLVRLNGQSRKLRFDTSLRGHEDWHYYLRLALLGPLSYLNKTVLKYRMHGSNASGNSHQMDESFRTVQNMLLNQDEFSEVRDLMGLVGLARRQGHVGEALNTYRKVRCWLGLARQIKNFRKEFGYDPQPFLQSLQAEGLSYRDLAK